MGGKAKAPVRRFSRADLKENCKVLETVVVGSSLATADEIADYRPGGSQNRDRGTWGWVNWKCALVRFNARTDGRGAALGGEDPDQLVLKALRREPARIEPVHLGGDMPNPLCIHPKGIDALLYFHAKDVLLTALAACVSAIEANPSAEDLAGQLESVLAEISYQHRLLVWCCTHPDAWLPFDPYKEQRPEPPAWTSALDAVDIWRVVQRHREVNGAQMRAIEALIAPDPNAEPSEKPLSWSVFASTISSELGMPASALLRDMSLAEVLAQTALTAGAKREALDRAKRDADRGRESDE